MFPGYELSGQVAHGSTGTVWRARQVELDRPVAIKELSPALFAAPGFLHRFRSEAQILAGLDDPHVVTLYDYVEEPTRAYLVQEWVDGAPLLAVLTQHGRLTAEQSLGVLRGALTGLAHAHQRGLVHGDISPSNILIDTAGVSKLLDFGLATPSGQSGAPGGSGSIGTPAFSSPEAVSGAPLTARSDVYSAGALLFLLLSGRTPYAGDVPSMLTAHTTAPVPTLDDHGPYLADLLRRAMAKNPAERPLDAAAFLTELEAAAEERYGPAWLTRASLTALITTTTATGTAAVAIGGTPGAAGAGAAAATAIAYGAAVTAPHAAGAVLPAAARAGRRILGMPVGAAVAGLAAVVIAAVVATVVVTTSSDDPLSAASESSQSGDAGEAAGGTEDDSEATETSTTTAAVPALSGTYSVDFTVTGVTGSFDTSALGNVFNETWVITAACPAGACDVSVSSSTGSTFQYNYSAGSWAYEPTPTTFDCVDTATGVPTGDTTAGTVSSSLSSTVPIDLAASSPIETLTGTNVSSVGDPGCGSGAGTLTETLQITRTGD